MCVSIEAGADFDQKACSLYHGMANRGRVDTLRCNKKFNWATQIMLFWMFFDQFSHLLAAYWRWLPKQDDL